MYFSVPTLTVLALALAPAAVKANFDIYQVVGRTDTGLPYEGYQVFEAEATDCDAVRNAAFWDASWDVSGGKLGVRCRGGDNGIGCTGYEPAGEIRALEMHFSNDPLYHFTIYRDYEFWMWGLDNKPYGQCIVFPHGDFDCGEYNGGLGLRKFRCLTDLTAEQLNNAAPDDYTNPGKGTLGTLFMVDLVA